MQTLRQAPRGTEQLFGPFLLLGALLALPLGSCLSEEKQAEKDERDRLTMEMFRELMEEGTLTPVDSMEDSFAGITAEMGDTPEDLRGGVRAPGVERPPEGEGIEEPGNYVELPPINPYAEFGKRIKVHQDTGLITKPYPMPADLAPKVFSFITEYGDFPLFNSDPSKVEPGPQPFEKVRIVVQDGMDKGMWVVVTANPERLADVEYFINTFAAGPPQIEIEAKIVEWVMRESLDLGVRDASMLFPDHTLIESLAWSFPNNASEILGGEFIANMGTIHDGVTYSAMFEALATFENVSIISRPKVAVKEGEKATIQAITEYPFLKVNQITPNGAITTSIAFQKVGVTLIVTPSLVGTDTVSLVISIEESQRIGSAITLQTGGGDGGSGFIDTPILATRKADTIVSLKPGQAVILGGLITERSVEEESGIPILMDIPVLGYLFKSKLTTTEVATLLFFIRPRILEGTDLTQDF